MTTSANVVVAKHWLALWFRKQFPWSLKPKTRRILGAVGLGWFCLNIWAGGIMMGLDAGGLRDWTWMDNASFAFNAALGIGLLWQAPRKPCKACGVAA